jgi:beta-1,4-mannosyl-glycoprotein beta-1,4-N-acetylglucosaminyltransferase
MQDKRMFRKNRSSSGFHQSPRTSLWILIIALLCSGFKQRQVPTFVLPPPKIYDCFLFFNEVEVLEIRLHELENYVDYFVIVESEETFRGNPKPLYYEKNKDRFKKFWPKIIHIIVEGHFETDNPWEREFFQRNQILRGVANCENRDLILISDLDEIPRGKIIPEMTKPFLSLCPPFFQELLVTAELKNQVFHLNRLNSQYPVWQGPVMMTCGCARLKSPQWAREHRTSGIIFKEAGWHFTWLGGVERIIIKNQSFSHIESDNAENNDPCYIRRMIENRPVEKINDSFPLYVREHEGRLKEQGLIADVP